MKAHPLMNPVHRFHIPVMGTGFTIDSALKVARYGISSVLSLVDDVLLEQMRAWHSKSSGRPYLEIKRKDEDSRAARTTAYLNLLDTLLNEQVETLRASVFEVGSEITHYFEMLPESPLKTLYERMLKTKDAGEKNRLQEDLRRKVVPGAIDVNIMTKVDNAQNRSGEDLPATFSDALSALRGYAQSRLESAVIFSAGINKRLYSYISEFNDFFPNELGEIKKRIVLKVSDYRSALVQGKLLARKGLWVSEFRIESGLNCGGHAFGGKGILLGPVLDEFRHEKERLIEQLHSFWTAALKRLGRPVPLHEMPIRITVQGGLGTDEERQLLEEHYRVDGTGWASPFLLVPEAVNIDEFSLQQVIKAGEGDVKLSSASPLGVPFWSLQTSASENERRTRIEAGKPGSACPKGFLVSSIEFTKTKLCTASRAYQQRKLKQLASAEMSEAERQRQIESVHAKTCICHDLAGSVTGPRQIDPRATAAVCCGPNTAYFSKLASLSEMVDHIYGRVRLPLAEGRPHMFLKELSLHLDELRADFGRRRNEILVAATDSARETRDNLLLGIENYRQLASRMAGEQWDEFLSRLDALGEELNALFPEPVIENAV